MKESYYKSASTIPIFNYCKAMEGEYKYLLKNDVDNLPETINDSLKEKLQDSLININKELNNTQINELYELAGEVKELEALHETMMYLNYIVSQSVFCSKKFREEFIQKKLSSYGLKLDVKHNERKIGFIKTKLNQSIATLKNSTEAVKNKSYKFDSERLFKQVKEVSQELGFDIDMLKVSIKDYLLHVEILSEKASKLKSLKNA